jgi:hypothetical protein
MVHQKWNGHFFEKAPLSTLGLRIQLGHDGGFHELTLQGKTTLYDFYHVLLRKTDNANVHPSIVCILFYTSFFAINLRRSHSIDTLKCIALFACGEI